MAWFVNFGAQSPRWNGRGVGCFDAIAFGFRGWFGLNLDFGVCRGGRLGFFTGIICAGEPGENFFKTIRRPDAPAAKGSEKSEQARAVKWIGGVKHGESLFQIESDLVKGADER